MIQALLRRGKQTIATYYAFMAGLLVGLVAGVILEAVCVYAIRSGVSWVT